jgi:MurNAc alpha-1-phosphate uridylyltransferase
MKALILAAGLGERMRPLTNTTPKPLLHVGGKPLIAWHLEKLSALGVRDVVINTSWLAHMFPQALGDGGQWGLRLHYSYEGVVPLETGGGFWNALPLLLDTGEPFLAVNGDIWTDYDFTCLPDAFDGDAHLVLVDNPPQHLHGDFSLRDDGRIESERGNKLTFSGIGLYRSSLFDDWRSIIGNAAGADEVPPRFKLAPLLRASMARGRVAGEHHTGRWTDVGTPQRLQQLDAELSFHSA